MHDTLRRHRAPVVLAIACLAGNACSSGPPDFAGRWQPLNRYAAAPQPLPLAVAPAFRATPVDRTLRTLLARWASSAGLRLDYALPDDYLLHVAMAGVGAADLATALRQVESAFAAQGVALQAGDGRLQARARAVPVVPAGTSGG